MAAGKPTILVIDGVIRDVIEKAKGGLFVPPGDDVALADTVNSLSRDPQSISAMGTAAREYVHKHFNRQEQAQQFVELLKQLSQ
jgi:glycosyltransferase involved in cell wall biosynthesis